MDAKYHLEIPYSPGLLEIVKFYHGCKEYAWLPFLLFPKTDSQVQVNNSLKLSYQRGVGGGGGGDTCVVDILYK